MQDDVVGILAADLDPLVSVGVELYDVQSRMAEFTALPARGIPADKLTDRDKLALAIAAGAPVFMTNEGGRLRVTTAVPVGVAERGDGGYVVAVGRA